MRVGFDIHEDDIDGVHTFWTNGEGPATAILSFRVGAVDEPLPRRGITHLVEHLALGPLGIQDYDHNGTVEALRTMFSVQGSLPEVVTFLTATSAALANLSTDRLLLERAVLRRESSEQPTSLGSIVRGLRYGPTGPGVIAEEEHGIGWLGPDLVKAWAAERFGRDNAVLVLNRPPPPDLKLPLGGGPRQPTLPAETPDWLPLPAHMEWPQVGVAMTYTMPRSPAANMATFIAHRRARNALRFEDGAVYDVAVDYDAIDATNAHAVLGTDTDEARLVGVTARLLEVHDRLVAEGPTLEEQAADIGNVERQFEHPDGRLAFIDFLAVERLLGREPSYPDDILARRRAVRPADVQAALSTAGESMLLASGPTNPAPERLKPYPGWSETEVSGTTIAPAGFRVPGFGRPERLILGADGLTVRLGPGRVLTVRFADVVAAVHLPGRRIVIGRDGFRVDVVKDAWRDGQRILDAIDRAVPSELVACDKDSPGALADPEGRT